MSQDWAETLGHCGSCDHWQKLREYWGTCLKIGRATIDGVLDQKDKAYSHGPVRTHESFGCSQWKRL